MTHSLQLEWPFWNPNAPRVHLSPRSPAPRLCSHLEALKFIKRDLNKPISHATSRGALGFYPKSPGKVSAECHSRSLGFEGPQNVRGNQTKFVRLFDVQNNNKQQSQVCSLWCWLRSRDGDGRWIQEAMESVYIGESSGRKMFRVGTLKHFWCRI